MHSEDAMVILDFSPRRSVQQKQTAAVGIKFCPCFYFHHTLGFAFLMESKTSCYQMVLKTTLLIWV